MGVCRGPLSVNALIACRRHPTECLRRDGVGRGLQGEELFAGMRRGVLRQTLSIPRFRMKPLP